MSDGTATPDQGREPEPGREPETTAWPQPGTPYPAPGQPAPGQPAPAQPSAGAPGGAWPPAGQPPQPAGPTQPPQPGYAPGGYPPPPAGAYPAAAPYAPGQYAPPPSSRTDGVSIAALVTGLLALAVVPLVLGIVGLRRTKRNGTQGRGLAIAGIILGALEIVGWIAFAIVVAFVINSYSGRIDTLRSECTAGQMTSCDDLYQESLPDSADEDFGWTCGERTSGGGNCVLNGAVAYGDSAELDALWDACEGGDMAACDTLYASSPQGSEYAEFGDTCGGQTDGGVYCDSDVTEGTDGTESTEGTALGGSYGDDPELDALWDSCQTGSGTACDDLYWASPGGSEYEDFGATCGGRVEFAVSCSDEIGA